MGSRATFLAIPDSIFLPESFIFPVFDTIWGPDYDHSEAAGVPTNIPPPIEHVIKMKVPRVDADATSSAACRRAARLAAWAPTGLEHYVGAASTPLRVQLRCGMVPFAKTKAHGWQPSIRPPDRRIRASRLRSVTTTRTPGMSRRFTAAANNAYNKGYLLAAAATRS